MIEMLKKLNITYCHSIDSSLDKMSELLNDKEKNEINFSPWDFTFNGKVDFSICHNGDAVYIKFFVVEKNTIAKYTNPNDPVYKDSCVEFFIALDGDNKYYNFEFNSSGTCLVQYGEPIKPNRKFLAVETIKQIKTISSYKTITFEEEDMINWELTIAIPKETFSYHKIDSFCSKLAKVNFYKCGDDLPQPHFLCWNPIQSSEPNFHVPEFFGEAIFES